MCCIYTIKRDMTCGQVCTKYRLYRFQIPSIGLWPSWPPNHPHALHHSVSSPPVAGVWGVFWCTMAAVASSSGGCCTLVVDEEIPPSPYYVKRFECLEKRYINVTTYHYYIVCVRACVCVCLCVCVCVCLCVCGGGGQCASDFYKNYNRFKKANLRN